MRILSTRLAFSFAIYNKSRSSISMQRQHSMSFPLRASSSRSLPSRSRTTSCRYFSISSILIKDLDKSTWEPVWVTTVTSFWPSRNLSYSMIRNFSTSHSFSFSLSCIFRCFSFRNCSSSDLSITSVTWPLSAVPTFDWRFLTNLIYSISLPESKRFSSFILSSSSMCWFTLCTKVNCSPSLSLMFCSNPSFILNPTARFDRMYEYVSLLVFSSLAGTRSSSSGPLFLAAYSSFNLFSRASICSYPSFISSLGARFFSTFTAFETKSFVLIWLSIRSCIRVNRFA